MSVALYMDAHVPGPVTEALRLCAIDITTAQDDGCDELLDPALLDRATALGRVLVSQDEDLLIDAARRQRQGIEFAGVVYAHQMKITIGDFIDHLEMIGKANDPDDMKNRVEWIPWK